MNKGFCEWRHESFKIHEFYSYVHIKSIEHEPDCIEHHVYGIHKTNKKAAYQSKSLQTSPAVGDFYGTGIEIWAGFRPNGQLSCLHTFKKSFDLSNHHVPPM